jgi:SAM-dependent methyltransferase
MKDYEDIAERFWSLPQKAEEENKRESLFMDDIIQKAHLDREIESRLAGVETVFDGGGGVGRFSIPLAARGLRVTHFDISPPMLEKARENAARAGVTENMEFVRGRLGNISKYKNGQFDLVFCFDAPVSYTYPDHQSALRELVRIARKAVIVSVSSRLGYIPYRFNPIQKTQYVVDEQNDDPMVRFYLEGSRSAVRDWKPDFDSVRREFADGLAADPKESLDAFKRGQAPWPVNYLFTAEDLGSILKEAGLRDIRLSGPGALARSIPREILKTLLFTEKYRGKFLDFCYEFDSQPSVCGLGKDSLVASGMV